MTKRKNKPLRKTKTKLTPNQKQFQKELQNLQRRAKSWEKTKGIKFTDFPTMPERVTKRDIERVHNTRWKNFSETERKYYKKEYEFHDQPTQLQVEYEPPTEDDYYSNDYDHNWYEPDWNDDWGQTDQKPVISEDEMEAWIDEKIDSILNPSLVEREREGARDILRNIIDNAKQQMGTRNFYKYLQDPEVCSKLESAAHAYLSSYQKRNGTDTGAPELEKFTQTLNLGRPITDEQAYELQAYGTVGFDYTDTDYD